jgi:hypothetical protein
MVVLENEGGSLLGKLLLLQQYVLFYPLRDLVALRIAYHRAWVLLKLAQSDFFEDRAGVRTLLGLSVESPRVSKGFAFP